MPCLGFAGYLEYALRWQPLAARDVESFVNRAETTCSQMPAHPILAAAENIVQQQPNRQAQRGVAGPQRAKGLAGKRLSVASLPLYARLAGQVVGQSGAVVFYALPSCQAYRSPNEYRSITGGIFDGLRSIVKQTTIAGVRRRSAEIKQQ
jgi:hypothetical protein